MYCPRCNARYDYEEVKCGLCGTELLNDTEQPVSQIPARIVPNYLMLSLAVTLACTWPFGLIAVILSLSANRMAAVGNIEKGIQLAKIARIFIILSIVFFFVVIIGLALFTLFTGELPPMFSPEI
jgi:hypothetical protein